MYFKQHNHLYHKPDTDVVRVRIEVFCSSNLNTAPTETEDLGNETDFDSLW